MREKIFTQRQIKNGFIRIFFMGVCFNACVAIFFWLKETPRHIAGNSLLLCAPLLLMIFYWWYYRDYVTQNEANRDQFADSLYFLGFLFTLMHLSFALVPWVFNPKMDPLYLLAQFGMAITTTLAGLFLRLTMSQFRDEGEGVMSVEKALGMASAAFIAQMEISTERLEGINKKSIPCLEEQTNVFLENMKSVCDEATNEIRKTRTAFGSTMTKILQNMSTKFDEATLLISNFTERQLMVTRDLGNGIMRDVGTTCRSMLSEFGKLVEETIAEANSILNKLKVNIGNVDLEIRDKMQTLSKELDMSAEMIKIHRERSQEMLLELNNEALKQIKEITWVAKEEIQKVGPVAIDVLERVKEGSLVKIDEIATEISSKLHSDLSGLILDAKDLLNGLKESIGGLGTFAEQIEYLNRIMSDMINSDVREAISDSSTSIKNLTENIRTLQAQFEELTKVKVEEDFKSLRFALIETARLLENTFKEINHEAVETNNRLQKEIRQIIDLREKLVIELTTSVELTQQVHSNLINGVQFLGKEFGRPS